MITTENLVVSYGNKTIINDLTVTIPKGKITALIGPNGCGKSTLLKCLARNKEATAGQIRINERALTDYPHKLLAQTLSLLPQVLLTPEGITVRRLVEYGRAPYLSYWGKLKPEDKRFVEYAMEQAGISELADHAVASLSGGQRQRAWIAMIVAQNTDIVLLDEPTTYLDLSHQVELMKLMRAMNQQGKTVVTVLHDLNQACRYCDHLIVLKQGRLQAQGSPNQVFTEALLQEVFSLQAQIIEDPIGKTPMCIAR